jgi:hypothetical protein
MGLPRHGPQDGQTLRRHLDAALAEKLCGVHETQENRSILGSLQSLDAVVWCEPVPPDWNARRHC